jgi:predicted RNase H-like nuclease
MIAREFRVPVLSYDEQREQYKLWYRVLPVTEFPSEIIEAAFVEHLKISKWFPKPAEIRSHAERLLDEERRTIGRFKQLLSSQVQTVGQDVPKQLTPEQVEHRRQQCVQWRREYGFGGDSPDRKAV